jgi:uncharacterized membrane protein
MIRKGLIGSIPLIGVIGILSLIGWIMVPEGQAVPVHWNAAGEVNRTGSRIEAFLAIPAIAVFLTLVFAIAPSIDPRGRNLHRSKALWLTAWLGSLGILVVAQGFITLSAIGLVNTEGPTMPRLIGTAVALFIMVIGNVLSKARPNWFAGIRTPWTLSSDRSWDVTHRWGARLFMGAGLVSVAALWLTGERTGWIIMFAAITTAALVPIGLSYFLWRADPKRELYSASRHQEE